MALDLDKVEAALAPRTIVYREATASTMLDAAALATSGCTHGSIVVADEQTAGHGRYGRPWHSERDTGLYVSVVLRLELPPETIPSLTLALGLAAAEAVSRVSGPECDLRWPNDVMIRDRKCAGILVQQHGAAFVAGIGVNVNQQAFPPDIAKLATSLRVATGREQSREELLVVLVHSIERYGALLAAQGRGVILDLFCRRSTYARGKPVIVERLEGEIEGVTDGLDGHGFLYVRKADGRRELILAGGVRPAPSPPPLR